MYTLPDPIAPHTVDTLGANVSNPTNQATTPTNQTAVAVNQNTTANNQATVATNQNTGGGAAHANVQPYFVCYIWKRTA